MNAGTRVTVRSQGVNYTVAITGGTVTRRNVTIPLRRCPPCDIEGPIKAQIHTDNGNDVYCLCGGFHIGERSDMSTKETRKIKGWMLRNVDRFLDSGGEVDCTGLVEAWDRETQDGGVTLDPDHAAWEIAVTIDPTVYT